jgi:uncharacterized membrane protein
MAKVSKISRWIDNDQTDYQDPGITSTVTVAGHPLHPLLVTFPVAFLVGALATDTGYWLTQDPFWARVSLWLVGVGFLSGLFAAVVAW